LNELSDLLLQKPPEASRAIKCLQPGLGEVGKDIRTREWCTGTLVSHLAWFDGFCGIFTALSSSSLADSGNTELFLALLDTDLLGREKIGSN